MTRTYALCKLLEHGALTAFEIQRITRWPIFECMQAIRDTIASGDVKRDRCVNQHVYKYLVKNDFH